MENKEGVVECSCLFGKEVGTGTEENLPKEAARIQGQLSKHLEAHLGKLGGWREMSHGLRQRASDQGVTDVGLYPDCH